MAMETDEDERKPTVYPPGPRHYIIAVLERPELWCVDRTNVVVNNDDLVGFMLTDDAMHFVNTERALDIGVFNTQEECVQAITEQMQLNNAATEAARKAVEQAQMKTAAAKAKSGKKMKG